MCDGGVWSEVGLVPCEEKGCGGGAFGGAPDGDEGVGLPKGGVLGAVDDAAFCVPDFLLLVPEGCGGPDFATEGEVFLKVSVEFSFGFWGEEERGGDALHLFVAVELGDEEGV